jgi:Domain of unknown function (DUF4124)
MKILQFLLSCVICVMSLTAFAQWQWTDKDGRRVFSDRAPPPEVPDKNILKSPGSRATRVSDATTASGPLAGASAAHPAASVPKLSGVDRDLAEKKKQAQDALLAKRKEDEQNVLKAKVENCARAKQAKVGFDSGVPIARFNEKGEREVLNQAARAGELQRIQAVISSDCE